MIAHFVEGVRNKDFFQSDFVSQGNSYQLCQVIQYKKNPDHFVAWIRNENGMFCCMTVSIVKYRSINFIAFNTQVSKL